jgi:hypothetical protein
MSGFGVPRTQRSAQHLRSGALRAGAVTNTALDTVPVLRSSAKSAASRPGHGTNHGFFPP